MDKLLKCIICGVLAAGLAGFINTAQAASPEKRIKKGNTLFGAGKYDEAIAAYDEAAVDAPESPLIYFNKGTALYKKGEYTAAREAFGEAAIKTKDNALEAKSKFNLGLCFFREGERQKDSDLKKTMESYQASIQSFQEALTLNPEFTEAAENIEMVRLMMKAVLDEIKKQEEEAQKQQEQMQQTAEKIKELIEKQKALRDRSASLLNNGEKTDDQHTAALQPQDIAQAQEKLKDDTQGLANQLAGQATPSAVPPPQGAPLPQAPGHTAKQHLEASANAQADAITQFAENELKSAADNQEKSLDDLNKALEALTGNPENQEGKQAQAGQNQDGQTRTKSSGQAPEDQQNQNQQEENPASESSGDEIRQPEHPSPDQNPQPASALQLPDDADEILNDEKENQKQRMPFSPGDFQQVDKDW